MSERRPDASGSRPHRTPRAWEVAHLRLAGDVLVRGRMKRYHVVSSPEQGVTMQEIPAGIDPKAFLEDAMDDCPLCQEARARGEKPLVMSLPRKGPFARRSRWRTRKRR